MRTLRVTEKPAPDPEWALSVYCCRRWAAQRLPNSCARTAERGHTGNLPSDAASPDCTRDGACDRELAEESRFCSQ